jgi:hypothetical protein
MQCDPDLEAACVKAFVIDRVVWADGYNAPIAATDLVNGDTDNAHPIAPRMSLDEVSRLGGTDGTLLSAAFLRASDVAEIDPRWNSVGDDIVWIVRKLDPAAGPVMEIGGETVSLVDDATGATSATKLLRDEGDADLARLNIAATTDYSCCYYGFFEILAGSELVRGAAPIQCNNKYPVSCYSVVPTLLEQGSYTVREWLVPTGEDGSTFPPVGECSTDITLRFGEYVTVPSTFPPGGTCSFGPLVPVTS